MKNYELLSLGKAGVFAITANSLDAAGAYGILKFKKAVQKAIRDFIEAEKFILEEIGIEDPKSFDEERNELEKSNSNPERLNSLNKQLARYVELRANLLNEDVELPGIKAINFEQFHELQKENQDIPGKPLNAFEEVLENVLWVLDEAE